MDNNVMLVDLAKNQKLNEIKLFLLENESFPINFTTDDGSNLLHFVATRLSENTLGIIQLLLEKGVDPLAVNEKFITPIEVAKENNNIPALTIMKHYINKKMQDSKNY